MNEPNTYKARDAIQQFGFENPVWAFAFHSQNPLEKQTRKKLLQKPIKGVLTRKNYSSTAYFVPYNKNMELSRSKKIHAESRQYAADYETAVKGYNQLIEDEQNKLRNNIQALENQKIT